jgi:hypothetical protein
VVAWVGALVLWPLAWPRDESTRWAYAPGALALAVGVGIGAWMHMSSPWTPRHPQAAMPLYVTEDGRAWRMSPLEPLGWGRDVLTADGGAIERRPWPGGDGREMVYAARAKPIALAAPAITVTKGADGTITLSAPMPAGVERLSLTLKTDTMANDVQVDGRKVPLLATPGKASNLDWYAAPEGVTVSFKPAGPGALDVGYAYWLKGWPADARPLPPRPAKAMIWDRGGSTVATGRLRSTW